MDTKLLQFKDQVKQLSYPSLESRIQLLDNLRNALVAYQTELTQAVNEDFGCRASEETKLAEFIPVLEQIKYTKKQLPFWMQAQAREVALISQPARSWVQAVPLGVVGIIVPWNYPILLALSPLITAIAAGNRAMLKMSELSPKTTVVLQKIIDQAMPDFAAVFGGDIKQSQKFSSLKFNNIFFTGSTKVGSLVMQEAAKSLIPVTLELGGKSPALLLDDTDFRLAAQKIAFGKVLNAGQTCVAPDYVLIAKKNLERFCSYLESEFLKLTPHGINDRSYTSIISEGHFQRLKGLLASAQAEKVIAFGDTLEEKRKIPLTLLINPNQNSPILQEEIFGPLLPIITFEKEAEVEKFIDEREQPLSFYLFTNNAKKMDHYLKRIPAGGLIVNDTLIHVAQEDLPFGGVGKSGMGQYHGPEGFRGFSHMKPVFQRIGPTLVPLISHPFQSRVLKAFLKAMGLSKRY